MQWLGKSVFSFSGSSLMLNISSRCVLTAVLGMFAVAWYSLGGHISDAEIEHEVREAIAEKEKRGKFFGLLPKKGSS